MRTLLRESWHVRVLGRRVIRHDRAGGEAVLLETAVAVGAVAAGVDHDAHADRVADFELGHVGADRFDAAADLVARDHGEHTLAPFGADGVDVAVAGGGVEDLDVHVSGARGVALYLHADEGGAWPHTCVNKGIVGGEWEASSSTASNSTASNRF